jgi:hypothetical protein
VDQSTNPLLTVAPSSLLPGTNTCETLGRGAQLRRPFVQHGRSFISPSSPGAASPFSSTRVKSRSAMYIPSNLFSHDSLDNSDAHSTTMSITKEKPIPREVLGKRKRKIDNSDGSRHIGCVGATFTPHILRLTGYNRQRCNFHTTQMHTRLSYHPSSTTALQSLDTESQAWIARPRTHDHDQVEGPAKLRRKMMLPKSQRMALSEITPTEETSPSPVAKEIALQPCHICHKKPKQKTDLDSYTTCKKCGERTCYICIRECQGGCNDKTICSSCCVEYGEDGTVACFDCYEVGYHLNMEV